jgi:hypothetical protein
MRSFEATKRGYVYTGISDLSHNFDQRREAFKKAGYKTYIVNETVSLLSRSSPGSHYKSLYVEKRYRTDERIKDLGRRLNEVPKEIETAFKNYTFRLGEIENKRVEWQEELNKLNAGT